MNNIKKMIENQINTKITFIIGVIEDLEKYSQNDEIHKKYLVFYKKLLNELKSKVKTYVEYIPRSE